MEISKKNSSIKYITIPGLHNSDEGHWHSIWENDNPTEFLRIEQENWDEPDCETWINRIELILKDFNKSEVILIGHSIGCMAIVHWLKRFKHKIKGALFVAPSDAEKENFPTYITGFKPIPLLTLSFPSIVIASADDHVSSLDRCRTFAKNWGSKLVILENAGHIETKSGYGVWKEGLELLKEL